MNIPRRSLLKAALAPLLLPLLTREAQASVPLSDISEIRIIQTKDPVRILERVSAPGFAHSMAQSTLAFIIESYPKGNLPVWKKPLSEIDLHSRIPEICTHVVQGVLRHASIYPVDPCWIMGQMMAESFFHCGPPVLYCGDGHCLSLCHGSCHSDLDYGGNRAWCAVGGSD